MIQKYLNRAFLWDIVFCTLISSILCIFHQKLTSYLDLPSTDNLDKVIGSLIGLGATLIGFLLTIVTIMVTFKNGTPPQEADENKRIETEEVFDEVPTSTVFDKKISKEKIFYNSSMYSKVLTVFISATYEIGLVVFLALTIQFDLIKIPYFVSSILILDCFILVALSAFRSIHIFRLYLNVHSGN